MLSKSLNSVSFDNYCYVQISSPCTVLLTPKLVCWGHWNALCCTLLYRIVMHFSELHCNALQKFNRWNKYQKLSALHCIEPQCTVLHCTALYWTVLNCSALQFTTLCCTVLNYTSLYASIFILLKKIEVNASPKRFTGVSSQYIVKNLPKN